MKLNKSDYQISTDTIADSRPVIGVVVALWSPDFEETEVQAMHQLTSTTIETLRDVGARPLIIDASDQEQQLDATRWLADLDGLLYLGGADIHPGLYSKVALTHFVEGTDVKTDQFCVRSLQVAVRDDLPTLGICRGSQLINVALGGSLLQHIDGHRTEGGDDAGFVDEALQLEASAKITKILGRTKISVRGSHHQAIDELAPALRVTARAHDETIEGTEHTAATWVVGLQWHPEETHANAEDRRKTFAALVAETKVKPKSTPGQGAPPVHLHSAEKGQAC